MVRWRNQLQNGVFNHSFKFVFVKLLLSIYLLFYIFDYCGLIIKLKEKDYFTKFDFPILGDIDFFIHELDHGLRPSTTPYNNHNYTLLINNPYKCDVNPNEKDGDDDDAVIKHSKIYLVILVKSAIPNFERRDSIRRSWGREEQFQHIHTRTVFLLGFSNDKEAQQNVFQEDKKYQDLIQGDFIDVYFNNTIKTLMGFQWAFKFCDKSDYYLFVDDDYYVSTKNLLLFLKSPSKYEEYAKMTNHQTQNIYKTDLLYHGEWCSLALEQKKILNFTNLLIFINQFCMGHLRDIFI